MVEAQQRLVQITPPTEAVKHAIAQLDTDEGRRELAALLLRDIDEWCVKQYDDGPRSHLGASVIGGKCRREIWYGFRWFLYKIHSGRMQRIFQRGHREEDIVISYLRGIGCTLEQVNAAGEQIRIYAVNHHFGGSSDGSAFLPESYGLPHQFLVEFKTVKDGNYDKVKDIRKDKMQHWVQMCIYGYKRGIRYGIYFFVNKDDDRLFIQVVELDWTLAQMKISEADYIIHTQQAPPRISNKPDWWECKMCDFYGLCQLKTDKPTKSCRTCVYSQPITDGYWQCNYHKQVIPDKESQALGCDNWTVLEY
jgi:hypothetical protein